MVSRAIARRSATGNSAGRKWKPEAASVPRRRERAGGGSDLGAVSGSAVDTIVAGSGTGAGETIGCSCTAAVGASTGAGTGGGGGGRGNLGAATATGATGAATGTAAGSGEAVAREPTGPGSAGRGR